MPSPRAWLAGRSIGVDAEIAADHAAVRDELLHHAAHEIHRDREADALRHRGSRGAALITAVLMPTSSPREFTSAPPELPTLIAASVWMKSSNVVTPSWPRPVALTMPIVTVWLKPSELPIASTTSPTCEAVGAAERDRRQVGQVDPQQRELGLRIRADELRRRDAAVGELHANLVGVANHVPVRHDVAAPVDHDARAELPAAQRDAGRRVRRGQRALGVDRRDGRRADGDRVARSSSTARLGAGRTRLTRSGLNEHDDERDREPDRGRLREEGGDLPDAATWRGV